jgi:F-box protein 11
MLPQTHSKGRLAEMGKKPSIFVSYSHRDTKWLKELDPYLEGLKLHASIERFDDRQLVGGEDWGARIQAALGRAKIVLLLVTANFIGSDYITKVELPAALKSRIDQGCIVMPILCEDCATILLQIDDISYLPKDPSQGTLKALSFWRGPQRATGLKQVVEQIYARINAFEQSAQDATATPPTREQAVPAAARTPTLKTQTRTLVVTKSDRGNYKKLTEALTAAKAGDRILIRKGTYKESIVIDKPVEIIGDGKLGDVVIEGSGTATVFFRTSMGRIANLKLQHTGGGSAFCVDIALGRLDLEGCDITSQSLACVAIHNKATPRLRANRIHGGKEGGIFVYRNGRGTLEDNDIFENGLAGVEIQDGGNPTLRGNRIHDGKEGGIYVHKSGRGIFENNEIFANKLAGVAIMDGGNPVLRRNSIHDGMVNGVYVAGGGRGVLEDNDIFANSFYGVEIKERSNPTLRHNRIHHGKAGGVMVNADGRGVLEDNDISANAEAGVTIWGGGNPTLRRNHISQNGYAAIRVHDGGQALAEKNDLRGNAGGAWDIALDCATKVIRKRNQE